MCDIPAFVAPTVVLGRAHNQMSAQEITDDAIATGKRQRRAIFSLLLIAFFGTKQETTWGDSDVILGGHTKAVCLQIVSNVDENDNIHK